MALMLMSVLLAVLVVTTVSNAQTALTADDKQLLLNLHKTERSQVNPTAVNMEAMVWNDELATVAQQYAEQCVFEHNSNRQSQSSTFSTVGENIAATSASNADYQALFQAWANEKQNYAFGNNTCSIGAVCGHYTQIVWATSANLGCGAFRCANLQKFMPMSLLLVCNYGPSGNFVGQAPYTSGPSCTQCPAEKNNCVQNQCSSQQPTTEPTLKPSTVPVTQPTNNGSTSTATPNGAACLIYTNTLASLLLMLAAFVALTLL